MTGAAPSPQIFRFGVFELDLRAGELRKQGLKIRLQEKPLQVLALLLGHPSEVITREELRRQLWPENTFVDFDHSINTAIKKLREALGDSAEHPRFIETLPRHGYRFIGHVEPVRAVYAPPVTEQPHHASAEPRLSVVPNRSPADSAPATAEHTPTTVHARRERRSWLAIIAATTVAGLALFGAIFALNIGGLRERVATTVGAGPGAVFPKIESIAVLPLENLSGDPKQEYFADGMTEELITDLGEISALRVISRQSVMRYKGSKKSLPEIARELHVDAIVEGAVRRSDDRVRITANLLYAPTDRHLWAETYERDLRDVLSLQDEVARSIASQVRTKLTAQEDARLASARPVDPEAYRLYLEGRYYSSKDTIPALEKSTQLFQQALQKDPDFALAYAGLSEGYGSLPVYGRALPKVVFPKAKAAALKALELDSTLAETHAALGRVLLYYDWDWSAAESELKRAIELNPNYAGGHADYAHFLSAMGRHKQAIAEVKRAQELDPVSPDMRTNRAAIYNWARRYDDGIEQSRKALKLDPAFGAAHSSLGWAYSRKGMYQEAVAEYKEAARLIGSDANLDLAGTYVMAGRRGEAVKMLGGLREQYRRGEISPEGLACLYTGLGEKQSALDWLQKAYEDRDPYMIFIKGDPCLDSLRSEPRFRDLLSRMNFPP